MKCIKKWFWRASLLGMVYYATLVAFALCQSPQAADIAVVLGNEVMADGSLSTRLAARVDCAINLYLQKKVHKIMVSGGKGANGWDEAQAMQQHLLAKAIPITDIIVDSYGINTMATAINAAAYMQTHQLNSAVLVTQYFHVPRTAMAFHMAGIRNFSSAYPNYVEWRDIPSTLREMVAIPIYWLSKPHVNPPQPVQ